MGTFDELKNAFKNMALLDLALTHRSWVNENPGQRGNNERLEFLGDAILEFIVSEALFRKFNQEEEGFLTALRAKLVNTVDLAKVANSLEIGKYLYLSKGEEEGGGRENPSLLADTVEAIIGALFLDGGLKKVKQFIDQNILNDLTEKAKQPLKDAKSLLQEIVQSKGFSTPKYQVLAEEGPDHAKTFTIQVLVDDTSVGVGTGKNKSEAAQNAAKSGLKKFL
jgi:ribonuclease-3